MIGDAGDHVRLNAHAAVGKHGIAGGHLHGRDRTGAQGHGEVSRMLVFVKAKFRDPFLRVACTDRLQEAN